MMITFSMRRVHPLWYARRADAGAGVVSRTRARARSDGQQSTHPHQVVGRRGKRERPGHSRETAVAQLPPHPMGVRGAARCAVWRLDALSNRLEVRRPLGADEWEAIVTVMAEKQITAIGASLALLTKASGHRQNG